MSGGGAVGWGEGAFGLDVSARSSSRVRGAADLSPTGRGKENGSAAR
ncbi:hypothetical protein J2X65_002233 [Ancylobacter sp. 3268]|nr:hypothetical protein [Ancylobacter sp. 3268]